MKNYEQIETKIEDKALIINLSRPEKLNAFTEVMMREIIRTKNRISNNLESDNFFILKSKIFYLRINKFSSILRKYFHEFADITLRVNNVPLPTNYC